MNWEIGVDEAGRGPLIGPMVYGCVATTLEARAHILEKPFIKDSKKLPASQRRVAYQWLMDNSQTIHVHYLKVDAAEIDEKMEYMSLNTISSDMVVAQLRQALRYIYKHDKSPGRIDIKLDTLSDNVENYAEIYRSNQELNDILKKHFPNTACSIQAFIGGDGIERVISAASIIAKETREIEIAILKQKYGDFGSGYPADVKTISWATKNFPSPADEICRKSWKTWKNIEKRIGVV